MLVLCKVQSRTVPRVMDAASLLHTLAACMYNSGQRNTSTAKKKEKTLGDKLSKYYQELVCYVSDAFDVMNIIQYGCHILYQSLALIAWCPARHILYELSAEKMPLWPIFQISKQAIFTWIMKKILFFAYNENLKNGYRDIFSANGS